MGRTRGAGVALGVNVAVGLGVAVELGVEVTVGVAVEVAVGVAVAVAVGVEVAVEVGVGVGVGPVARSISRRCLNCCRNRQSPPDDHFAAGPYCRVTARAVGALVVLVAVQLSAPGSYLPPVFKES